MMENHAPAKDSFKSVEHWAQSPLFIMLEHLPDLMDAGLDYKAQAKKYRTVIKNQPWLDSALVSVCVFRPHLSFPLQQVARFRPLLSMCFRPLLPPHSASGSFPPPSLCVSAQFYLCASPQSLDPFSLASCCDPVCPLSCSRFVGRRWQKCSTCQCEHSFCALEL